jgi:cytochrome c553
MLAIPVEFKPVNTLLKSLNIPTEDIYMKSFFITLTTTLLFASSSVMAGDVAAGKAKSVICAACHGATGESMNPMWPNLKGQKELYLARQIKAFRDGTRKDPTMAPMVAGLTDDDIANLAAYYAAQ